MNIFGGDTTVIFVDCFTLQNLFDKHNITHIDFLSIDIEGGEEAAIQSIDFAKVTIDIIVVENNFNEQHLRNYLETKGYVLINHLGKDDVYVLRGYYE